MITRWMIAAAFTAATASAATVSFDFVTSGGISSGSGFSNLRTYASGSLQLTITGWGMTAGSSNTQLERAQVGFYSGNGLGICDQDEGLGCSSPTHQLDNSGRLDFLLFSFNQPVNPLNIRIRPFGDGYGGESGSNADTDATFWLRQINTAFDLNNATLADLTASKGFTGPTDSPGPVTSSARDITLSGTGVYHILLGAETDGDFDDFFKVQSLTVSTAAVPEPATFGLIGIALLGLGLIRRGVNR